MTSSGIEPLTALLKGKTLYSPSDKMYLKLFNKEQDKHGSVGQLMLAHDGYQEYAGDYGTDIVFEPANTSILIAFLAEGAWEVIE